MKRLKFFACRKKYQRKWKNCVFLIFVMAEHLKIKIDFLSLFPICSRSLLFWLEKYGKMIENLCANFMQKSCYWIDNEEKYWQGNIDKLRIYLANTNCTYHMRVYWKTQQEHCGSITSANLRPKNITHYKCVTYIAWWSMFCIHYKLETRDRGKYTRSLTVWFVSVPFVNASHGLI